MGMIEYEIDHLLEFLLEKEKTYRFILDQSPPGSLQVLKEGTHYNYVHSTPVDGEGMKYLRRGITKNETLIRALADKEYARCALNLIEHDLKLLKKMRRQLKEIDPVAVRLSMKRAYQTLPDDCIRELRLPQEKWALHEEWASQPYELSSHRPELRNKKTSRGLYVRTKAEVLIAEMLYHYGIPFRYEQVIHIGQYRLAPDFTFEDRNCEEFFWEYCGMMDDSGYVEHHQWKRKMYESIGINEWTNIIYTYDRNNDIDMHKIDLVIREQILPRL